MFKRFWGSRKPDNNCQDSSSQNNSTDSSFVSDGLLRVRIDSPLPMSEFSGDCNFADQSLIAALEEILQKQDKDAEKRSSDSWYFGNTGRWVRFAAWDARRAVQQNLGMAVEAKSLDPILMAVVGACAQFREAYDADDEDGYGIATFGEILRDLLKLQESRGETVKYDLDTLWSLTYKS